MKVSACTFIRNNFDGAFCVFESMASLLPFVDDMHVLDLGSTDGTLGVLEDITKYNKRVHLHHSQFSHVDAAAFADAANDCIKLATHDVVLFWQADEIWHEDLLRLMRQLFEDGCDDLSFWRYQLRENFQAMKWFPHPVHRVGRKDRFNFVNDGMNSDRTFDARLASTYGMEYFPQWGTMDPLEIPVNEMICDVGQMGGFRDNIPMRRALHAPMWHEDSKIEGLWPDDWLAREYRNDNWVKPTTPFDIPYIMEHHVGRVSYGLNAEVLEALKADETEGLLYE